MIGNARLKRWAGAASLTDAHSLWSPLVLALGIAVAVAAAAAVLAARAPGGPDPVEVVNLGRHWRSRLAVAVPLALVASLVVGVAVRRVGTRAGIVTMPRLWRVEAAPTPLLGVLAILSGVGVGFAVGAPAGLASRTVLVAGAGVVVMAVVGFLDDIRTLTPRTRVLWTAVVAEAAWLAGLRADVFGSGAVGDAADALLTMLWFVGVTHAFNVFDNMDGASAGVAVASSLSIAALAWVTNQGVLVVLALALAAGCLGYLAHNVFPARLYMGDSGALSLGFAVAALGLMLKPPVDRPLGFALPVLAAGVPIFDTVLVTISRKRNRRRVAIGGTDHITHRLHVAGIAVRTVAPVLLAAQIALGGVALLIALAPRPAAWAVLAVTAVTGAVALPLLLRLPEWTEGPDR